MPARERKSGQFAFKIWTPDGLIWEANTKHNLTAPEFREQMAKMIERIQTIIDSEPKEPTP